jgi:putative FmdB family regulatory protein
MPLYDYLCDACGPFEALAPMERYADPCDCPDCGSAAPRALLSAPRLVVMDGARRQAFETNERSRHAPHRSTAEERRHRRKGPMARKPSPRSGRG